MSSKIISLELTQKLQDLYIITEFTFNPENRNISLNLNTRYNNIPTLIFPISFDQFDELQNEDIENIRRELLRNEVESSDIRNILEILELDMNKNRILESIREYYIQNLKESKQAAEEEKEENNNYNKKEIINEEEQRYDSVSLTLRKHFGSARPRGTITGISKLFKMISKVSFYCDHCKLMTELDFPLPKSHDKDIEKKCGKCHKFTRNDLNPEYKNAVIIELQDTDSFNDMDRLPVFLFDEATEKIRIGETVIITGDVEIGDNGKRLYTCLYGKSIHYLNRGNFTLSENDIKEIDEFVNTTTNKSQLIDKLVSIFDTSIVEYDHVKKGLLMAAVKTSDDITRNERINILLIGDPGLAKSKLAKRVTELVPNSRHESGQSSSGKSLTAIIEKTDENTFLRPGPIPLAKGTICSINELGRQSMEDQGHLLDVMEEGEFTKNAFGKNVRIRSPTTIIATANPVNNSRWRDNDKVDLSEFPVLEPIRDCFDLKFVFKDRNEWKEIDEFADKLSEIEDKKDRGKLPDYTIFLIKYLQ
jgi:replicative DNA helicase Mcm